MKSFETWVRRSLSIRFPSSLTASSAIVFVWLIFIGVFLATVPTFGSPHYVEALLIMSVFSPIAAPVAFAITLLQATGVSHAEIAVQFRELSSGWRWWVIALCFWAAIVLLQIEIGRTKRIVHFLAFFTIMILTAINLAGAVVTLMDPM